MFQFGGFAPNTYGFSAGYQSKLVGFPIRKSPDNNACLRLPEAYRSFATSFIAWCRQGIHAWPLLFYLTINAPTFAIPQKGMNIRRLITPTNITLDAKLSKIESCLVSLVPAPWWAQVDLNH